MLREKKYTNISLFQSQNINRKLYRLKVLENNGPVYLVGRPNILETSFGLLGQKVVYENVQLIYQKKLLKSEKCDFR